MNKQILRLAIPNILSNLSIPLLSSVDTAVMGHLNSEVYLGAIALGSMIFNFIYWGFGFLRMGTTGLTAQVFGSKNNSEIQNTLFRSVLIGVSLGFVLFFLQNIIAEISFYLIKGSPEVENYASEYFHIRIFAAPATLAMYSIHGWFLGMQNSKYPLYISLFVNILNIILNLFFVYQLDMKVSGIALGTVISQYLGLIFSIILIVKSYSNYLSKINFRKIIDKEKLIRFFKVNTDIFIRTLLLIFAISFFTAKSAEFDNVTLAANFILFQLWLIVSYGVDGFAFAAESLVGKYIGANENSNVKKVIKFSFYWGISLSAFLGVVYFFFENEILKIYTNQTEVIETAMVFMIWIVFSPIINSISFIWDGIFIGATKTREMLISMIMSVLVFFLPSYYITKDVFGNHSIWFALTIFMVMRGLTLSIFYFTKFKKQLN
ncbi:MAG: MATE family efflux transporter [Ignavibacteriales bacterium]|nr:MATE family efflux transporter [Ignavibacteriales bacterium]